MEVEAKTFREAYGVLQGHAQTLREQKEPNIDQLLSIVTESVAAYNVCRERIDAVEKALQEALSGAGDGGGRSGVSAATGAGAGGGEGEDATAGASGPARNSATLSSKTPAAFAFDNPADDMPF